jgi:hypothetical protein
MKSIRLGIICFSLLLAACGPTGQVTSEITPERTELAIQLPTVTSYRGYHTPESLVHAGTFRLTVTQVLHLSNAFMLSIQIENISGTAATWSPGETVSQVYILDGVRQLSPLQVSGVFERDITLEPGKGMEGQLVFPLPVGETFQLFYPNCEPTYVILQAP